MRSPGEELRAVRRIRFKQRKRLPLTLTERLILDMSPYGNAGWGSNRMKKLGMGGRQDGR